MAKEKPRVEPEIKIPPKDEIPPLKTVIGASDDEKDMKKANETGLDNVGAGQGGASVKSGPSVEDLVPDIEAVLAGEHTSFHAEEIRALEERINALEAERDQLRDKMMRALAEGENIRRRAERDRRDAEIYGGTKLARDLLSVHDNLDRALGAADDTLRTQAAAFIEGVELTQRELLNAFAKHKIEKIVPEQGEKFDPNRHQAMFEAPIPGATPGTVIEVMQSGFIIGERLLRPALVGVARAVAPTAQSQTPENPPEKSAAENPAENAAENQASAGDPKNPENTGAKPDVAPDPKAG